MSLPDELLKVFNNYKNFPILENVVSGDYIDNIHPKQMKSSIMKGTDNYNRPFIAIKIFPRELYKKMMDEQYKNHESCLTLVALTRNYYLPPDIARLIQTFLDFRPSHSPYQYESDEEEESDKSLPLLNPYSYLQNQISVHTLFRRYTTTPCTTVHGENSSKCEPKYRYHMLDIETVILNWNGKWNNEYVYSYDPKSEFEKLLRDQHPKSIIYNDQIGKLISGKYM